MDLSRRLYLQIPFFEQFAANKYCNFKFTLPSETASPFEPSVNETATLVISAYASAQEVETNILIFDQ